MKYTLKQKVMSSDYTILDGDGNEAYSVKGQALKVLRNFSIRKPGGDEVANVCQVGMIWKPTFHILRESHPTAIVTRRPMSVAKVTIDVKIEGEPDIEVAADVLENQYVIRRGGADIGRLHVKHLKLTNTMEVQVEEGRDDLLVLGVAVAVAQVR